MVRAARLRTVRAVSAGGIVYRQTDAGTEVVLCGRDGDGIWGLPKGTPEAGEDLEQTAIREVTEETGLEVVSEGSVGQITYWFVRPEEGKRYHKTVHYFLMCSIGGDTSRHDHEYDRVEWFPAEQAARTATYQNEASMIQRAVELVKAREAGGARA